MDTSSNGIFYTRWRTTRNFLALGVGLCPHLIGAAGDDAVASEQEAFPALDRHFLADVKLSLRKQSVLGDHKRDRAWVWFAEGNQVTPSSIFSAMGLRGPFQGVASVAGKQQARSRCGVVQDSLAIQKLSWSLTPVLSAHGHLPTPLSVLLADSFPVPL